MKKWVAPLTLVASGALVALSLLHHPAPPAPPAPPAAGAAAHRAQRRLPRLIPGTLAEPASPDVRPTPR